jgi:hypothetical protein
LARWHVVVPWLKATPYNAVIVPYWFIALLLALGGLDHAGSGGGHGLDHAGRGQQRDRDH